MKLFALVLLALALGAQDIELVPLTPRETDQLRSLKAENDAAWKAEKKATDLRVTAQKKYGDALAAAKKAHGVKDQPQVYGYDTTSSDTRSSQATPQIRGAGQGTSTGNTFYTTTRGNEWLPDKDMKFLVGTH